GTAFLGNEQPALGVKGHVDEREGKLCVQVARIRVRRNYHLNVEPRRDRKTFATTCIPDEIPPRTGFPVSPKDFDRKPIAIIEVDLFPALGRTSRSLPRAVADLLQPGTAIGNITDAYQESRGTFRIPRLHSDDVLTIKQMLLHIELMDAF